VQESAFFKGPFQGCGGSFIPCCAFDSHQQTLCLPSKVPWLHLPSKTAIPFLDLIPFACFGWFRADRAVPVCDMRSSFV
jgi:hypothetical protein